MDPQIEKYFKIEDLGTQFSPGNAQQSQDGTNANWERGGCARKIFNGDNWY